MPVQVEISMWADETSVLLITSTKKENCTYSSEYLQAFAYTWFTRTAKNKKNRSCVTKL